MRKRLRICWKGSATWNVTTFIIGQIGAQKTRFCPELGVCDKATTDASTTVSKAAKSFFALSVPRVSNRDETFRHQTDQRIHEFAHLIEISFNNSEVNSKLYGTRHFSQKVDDPMPDRRSHRCSFRKLSAIMAVLFIPCFSQLLHFQLWEFSPAISITLNFYDLFIFFLTSPQSDRVKPLHSYLRSAKLPLNLKFRYSFVGYSSENTTDPPNLALTNRYLSKMNSSSFRD
jgi:hypothetical protein